MTLVTPLDAVALFTLGILSGYLYRHVLFYRLPDWNVKLGVLSLGGYAVVVGLYNIWAPASPLFYDIEPLVAAIYFTAYPHWYFAGTKLSYAVYGKYPSQGGLKWLLGISEDD